MKKSSLTLIVWGIMITAFSQTNPHFISINLGASIPLADYASTDGTNEDAGFAKTGVNFALEGAGFINKTVGFGGYIGGNTHNIDEDAFIKELTNDAIISSASITADPYTISNFMLGIYLSVPADDAIFFRFKILGGMFAARVPEMSITATSVMGQTMVLDFTEATSNKFSALFGGSVLFKVSDRIGLSANLEYTTAELDFEYDAGGETVTAEQKFSVFNISAGLNILLGKVSNSQSSSEK